MYDLALVISACSHQEQNMALKIERDEKSNQILLVPDMKEDICEKV
ncbi:hypothetical protein GCM10010954_29830 [Halobacillus andaensis]|uniref:Uncharacterized protein n=1 Tax=Halobacillus andaensis TaxID=1176239 RepID=A0A917B803_HALAA|nr:hypothetical protein GCM10010954_29830 [Halobacillus andaensis]